MNRLLPPLIIASAAMSIGRGGMPKMPKEINRRDRPQWRSKNFKRNQRRQRK